MYQTFILRLRRTKALMPCDIKIKLSLKLLILSRSFQRSTLALLALIQGNGRHIFTLHWHHHLHKRHLQTPPWLHVIWSPLAVNTIEKPFLGTKKSPKASRRELSELRTSHERTGAPTIQGVVCYPQAQIIFFLVLLFFKSQIY